MIYLMFLDLQVANFLQVVWRKRLAVLIPKLSGAEGTTCYGRSDLELSGLSDDDYTSRPETF